MYNLFLPQVSYEGKEKEEMDEETIDSKDFKIFSLEQKVSDLESEISRLLQQKLNARYFAILGYERVIKALDGDLEAPTLRSIDTPPDEPAA